MAANLHFLALLEGEVWPSILSLAHRVARMKLRGNFLGVTVFIVKLRECEGQLVSPSATRRGSLAVDSLSLIGLRESNREEIFSL